MARQQRGKQCNFCKKKVAEIDYKDAALIQKYLSGWAKIKSARESGNCSKHQRQITDAIKHARFMALLPFTTR